MSPDDATAQSFRSALLLGCLLAGCTTTAQRATSDSAGDTAIGTVESIAGVTLYVPVSYVSRMPFIVLDVNTTGSDNFDYQLRDELQRAGFPRGIMQSQLAKVYVDAGLAETTPFTGDPISMRRLSDVVGPFVRLRVDYEMSGFGMCNYQVELWDVRSASPVLQLERSKLIWWSVSKELGPDIVQVLTRWREDSLRTEGDEGATGGMPAQRT